MKTSRLFGMLMLALAILVAGLLGTSTADAAVGRQSRVLIILTDLDTHGFPELAPLYQTLENIGVGLPNLPVIRDNYLEIHTLQNQAATLARFRSLAERLAMRSEVKAIDVILMLHGGAERLYFANGGVDVADMAEYMTRTTDSASVERVRQMKKKFRMMYNTSCFGSSHRSAFRSVGFDAVAGSIGVNANSEAEFPSFLALWNSGVGFEAAFAPTNNDVALAMTDGPLRTAGEWGRNFLARVNSKKRFSGATALTINSDPN